MSFSSIVRTCACILQASGIYNSVLLYFVCNKFVISRHWIRLDLVAEGNPVVASWVPVPSGLGIFCCWWDGTGWVCILPACKGTPSRQPGNTSIVRNPQSGSSGCIRDNLPCLSHYCGLPHDQTPTGTQEPSTKYHKEDNNEPCWRPILLEKTIMYQVSYIMRPRGTGNSNTDRMVRGNTRKYGNNF